jgi:hypothetical protein
MNASIIRVSVLAVAVGLVAGCGGGYTPSSTTTGSAAPVSVQASGASAFPSGCGSAVPTGTTETFTPGSSVQPQIAAIPGANLVGVWEQDRWTGLGARGILASYSTDGGMTWKAAQTLPFSACSGVSVAGVQYDRASDPWLTFAGNGVVIASAIAFSANGFTGTVFTPNGLSAVLVSRSTDGGVTWSAPHAVIQDTNPSGSATLYFNDRDSITADPTTGSAYLVWDRINNNGGTTSQPAWLAKSTDGGATWGSAGILYDPGSGNEAFNNEVVILPNGTLLDFFTLVSNVSFTSTLQVVSSVDQGAHWTTAPVTVANITTVGTTNPIGGGTPIRDAALLAQVAADPASGNVAAVWQQMFNGNGAFDGIALSMSTDGGKTWSTPKQINGVISVGAIDPTVRYLPGSVIAVTYYDFRDFVSGSTALSTSAWLTESNDNGATWHELRLQNPFDLNQAPLANLQGAAALFLGDNQGLGLVSGNALPFYTATNSAGGHIYATRSPSPLTTSGAHGYSALLAGPVPAAAAAQARALVEQRIRMRATLPP